MKYRAEIDGLRALAVVPVILFHAGIELFSGGFVGVDVFFVISGYLITSILIEDIDNNRFSVVSFYERRARRILPALFFVMLVCIPFAWVWMLPSQMKDFSQSLIGVSLFASNIMFSLEGDYFDSVAEEKPLLHTWTLAVEEQYYILFPLFLLLTWRLGRNKVFWIIVVFAVLSLALSEWGWRNNTIANFYLAPTRAWELFAGSITAFILQNRTVKASNTLSIFGLMAIICTIFIYDKSTPFPSVYALVPVTGVMLIILFADGETFAAKLLRCKALVSVGMISYSAYLWHQPLFAYARIRSLQHPSLTLMCFLSVISMALAWVSWKFIETPIRKNKSYSRLQVFLTSGLLAAAFVTFGLLASNSKYFEDKFRESLSEDDLEIYSQLGWAELKGTQFIESWRYGSCFYGSKINSFNAYDKETCLSLSTEKKNVLLIGDSHAVQWYPGLVYNYGNINFLQANASGCRPLLHAGGAKRCTELRNFIYADFLKHNYVDTIILAARWEREEALNFLPDTLSYLKGKVGKVYVFGPTVEYWSDLPIIIISERRKLRSNVNNELEIDVAKYVNAKKFLLSQDIKEIVEAANVKYIPVVEIICPDRKCKALTDEGKAMSFDYGHLTNAGSIEVVEKMKKNYSLLKAHK